MQNRFRFIYKKMVDKKMTSGFKVEEEYVHIFLTLLYCIEPRSENEAGHANTKLFLISWTWRRFIGCNFFIDLWWLLAQVWIGMDEITYLLVLKAVLKETLKGVQCHEPVKSRVPIETWNFLVTLEQKLGARGDYALPEHSLGCVHLNYRTTIIVQLILQCK